ncbi:hypothetical protein [Pseudaquabacterium pictum]|nr:hypothetical protein [Rubrivivax pictus]
MTTVSITRCPPITLPERGLRFLAAGLLAAADGWRRRQLQRADARQQRLDAALSEDLSPALLRDIGAPAWLEVAARARRAADDQRLQAQRLDACRMFL